MCNCVYCKCFTHANTAMCILYEHAHRYISSVAPVKSLHTCTRLNQAHRYADARTNVRITITLMTLLNYNIAHTAYALNLNTRDTVFFCACQTLLNQPSQFYRWKRYTQMYDARKVWNFSKIIKNPRGCQHGHFIKTWTIPNIVTQRAIGFGGITWLCILYKYTCRPR